MSSVPRPLPHPDAPESTEYAGPATPAAGAGHPILRRVLRAIELNRSPGFHFSGNFLAMTFDRIDAHDALVTMTAGPHCTDAQGRIDPAAVDILADLGMATSVRALAAEAVRMATVTMQLQFTGVPCTGTLRAQAGSHGFIEGAAGRQALSRFMITGDQGLVCMGMGTFMVLDMPPGMRTLPPLFGHPRASYDAAPDPGLVLEADEAPILARARKALRSLDGTQAFSEMLWDFRARKTATGASGTVANGPHIGNRVGHVQGGLTVAFAQATANAALSEDWMFNGITAGYVRPGEGARLTARATLVHQGRSTAVVRVEVFGQDKRRVLEATTTHSLRAK